MSDYWVATQEDTKEWFMRDHFRSLDRAVEAGQKMKLSPEKKRVIILEQLGEILPTFQPSDKVVTLEEAVQQEVENDAKLKVTMGQSYADHLASVGLPSSNDPASAPNLAETPPPSWLADSPGWKETSG